MVDQSPWVMLTPAQAAAVDRLRAELEAAKLPRTCVWAEDPDGVWEGSCGMMWNLESGTPAEKAEADLDESKRLVEGRAASSPCPPPALSDAEVFRAFSMWTDDRDHKWIKIHARAWFGPLVAYVRTMAARPCVQPGKDCGFCDSCEARLDVAHLRARAEEASRG